METRKLWQIGELADAPETLGAIHELSARFGVTEAFARLLCLRGYDSIERAEPFLKNSQLSIYDPFLMKDMEPAAQRVCRAIEKGESVAVLGDYDADGVSATALLYRYLSAHLPEGRLGYYIPDRFSEGYGMSRRAIDAIHERGATLIITVDNGITALAEVAYAEALGMDVVITDHHECRETLPSAVAVVDPHRLDCQYPFSDLAGVGVAFKLVTAVEARLRGESTPSPETVRDIYRGYSDLAMLGTIADVMPVTGENRAIIIHGLAMLKNDPRPGLKALLEKADKNGSRAIGTSTIGFGIGPRINAAGRMAHASQAVELLLLEEQDDKCHEAAEFLAEELCRLNTERQKKEAAILEQLETRVAEQCHLSEDRVLVVADDEWHPGVIGIAAAKAVEKYGRPAILITFQGSTEVATDPDDEGRGSGRSIEGVNLIEAIRACEEHLIRCGGHELAAGLSVARGRVDDFRTAINAYVKAHETENTWTFTTKADMALAPSEITLALAEDIVRMEPFGIANPTPLFYMPDVSVVSSRRIGGGIHLRFRLARDGAPMEAVMFHAGYEAFAYEPGDRIDILFGVEINEYNGSRMVQLHLKDTRYSATQEAERIEALDRYHQICAGAAFAREEDILPGREEFAAVYKLLWAAHCEAAAEISERLLYTRLRIQSGGHINRIKLRVILDVLNEMALCEIRYHEPDRIEFHMNTRAAKVDLEASPLLRTLRTQCE